MFTLGDGSVIEAGAYRGAFRDTIEADDPTGRLEHLLVTNAAYAVWDWPRGDWFHWVFSFQAGRARRKLDNGAFPESAEDKRTTELKAGAGFVLQEAGSYRFFFNTTWDLDVFSQRQWDGGNVQLVFSF